MSEDVRLRAAVSDDATTLLTLAKRLRQETDLIMVDEQLDHLTPAMEAAAVERLNASGTNLVAVAAVSTKLVGLVTITEQNPAVGELGIAVLKDYQGLGLGAALLDLAVDWFINLSRLEQLRLTVKESNQRALHLYQHSGFQITQQQHDIFTMTYKNDRSESASR
ncbi:GNAT family N-acetyltransferase [Fructilactobacillus carniphilus]|uniref:GNAT family N-acetyltransferase n=1 Tax=Fructilactobacillus carniphilus TaxID=2940297 RepID=A0ABY5BW60_9LACO|nr:GNAT family N-acetyltransferase [Fructilactobacillus carniphilus]USS90044.1 GNAT family N-acetyltransferase [Fructilactobacillus carniphilus]